MKEIYSKYFHIVVLGVVFSFITINLLVHVTFGFSEVYLEFLAPEWNRELGLLENLQNIILLLCLWLVIKLYRRENTSIYKYTYIAISFFLCFLFFEEVDYFMHFYDFIFYGKEPYVTSIKGFRNIHNIDFMTFWRRLFFSILLLLTGGFLIILGAKRKKIKYLLVMLFLLLCALNGGLEDNRQICSETKELCLYTVWYFLLFTKVYPQSATSLVGTSRNNKKRA